MHGRQLGEHGIHERFSPRAGQISEIEQSIDSHRRWQGCFVCAGHPLFEQKDRIGCGDVSLHPEVVDRLRWCQTEPSAGAKTTARRPRGEGRRGCREPFGAVLGGGSTPHRLSGQPVRDRTTPVARGDMGRRREEFRRSRPLSSGRGLRFDGYFLLNEGWLDGSGGSTVRSTVDQPQQGQTQTTHFSGGTCSGAFDQTGGL